MGDESNESESSESEIDSEGEQPIEWTNRLRNIDVEVFTSPVWTTFELGNEAKELDVFKLSFDDEMTNCILTETSHYGCQKLSGQVLDRWQELKLNEIKAFLGVSIGGHKWASNLGNLGIQKVMTNDSSTEPQRGEDGYDHLYKVRPISSQFNSKM